MCWSLEVSILTALAEVSMIGVLIYRARVLGRSWEYAPCLILVSVAVVELTEVLIWWSDPPVHEAGSACAPSLIQEGTGIILFEPCCEFKHIWEGSLNSLGVGAIRLVVTLQPVLMLASCWLVQPAATQARFHAPLFLMVRSTRTPCC